MVPKDNDLPLPCASAVLKWHSDLVPFLTLGIRSTPRFIYKQMLIVQVNCLYWNTDSGNAGNGYGSLRTGCLLVLEAKVETTRPSQLDVLTEAVEASWI